VQLEFEHLLSRVEFTFKNNLSEGNITITNVQITEAAKTAELNCADASIANWTWNATATGAYNFGNTSTIAQGASASAENVQFLFPATTRNYDISFSIAYESDAAEARTATIADVNFVMGKAYNINVTIADKDIVTEQYKIEFFVAEVKDWGDNIELEATLNKPSRGFENGHEYVDLGLTSGLKWAICNIGANSPEEYGDYFDWGEVEPKTTYDWSPYKYCDDSGFTKYNEEDCKILLDPEDDAATVNWGSSWRMPSYEEFEEMYTGCQWEHDYDYEGTKVFVYVGTSKKNGNKIIIPYSGEYEKTQYNSLYTSFWTSTYFENAPYIGRCFLFYEPYLGYSGERCYGKNIRAVVK
jgi:hypothetical protein